jgi:aryl-alcohol dehydrogenase-like predicted oxidoreductase
VNAAQTRRIGRSNLEVTGLGLGAALLGDLFVRVVAMIPGAVSAEQLRQNAANFGADIPAPPWAELKAEGLLPDDAPVPG